MGIKYEEHPKLFLSGFIIWLLLFIYMFIDIWLSNNRQNSYLNEIRDINGISHIDFFMCAENRCINDDFYKKSKCKYKYQDCTNINTTPDKVIDSKELITKISYSLKKINIVNKTYGKTINSYIMKINFKNRVPLMLRIRDCGFKDDSIYLFYYYLNYNEYNEDTLNLKMESKHLKSVLKSLNLPNWKEK